MYRAVEEPEDGVGVGETFAVKYYVDETRTVTEEGLGCTTIRELSTVSVSCEKILILLAEFYMNGLKTWTA